jgi:peptide/nickel transport system substrate-binding protein
MRIAVLADPVQQLAQFAAGNLHELLPSINDLATARQQNPKAAYIKAHNGTPTPWYLQLGDPGSPFMDVRVRRALSMAVDRDALDKALFNGQSEQMAFVPSYMGKWALAVSDLPQDIRQYYQYNPAEVKKLLEAAGVANLQVRFVYIANGPFSTAFYNKQAETLNSMLNSAGFKSNLVPQDYQKDYIDSGKGSRQGFFDKDIILLAGVGVVSEADEFLFANFSSKSTSNAEHVKDPGLDAMIDKQRTIVNEDARLKAVLDIERYIADKMYVVPTPGSYRNLLVQPNVHNYQFSDSLGKDTETYAKLWLAK